MPFSDCKNIKYGFSEKPDGNMRVFINQPEKRSKKNRQVFFKKEKINTRSIVLAELIHGNKVIAVDNQSRGKIIMGADALITKEKNLTLALTAADCLVIYFYDPKKQAIGLAHAGWRGLLNNLITKTVISLEKNYHSQAKDLQIYISPHIQVCHFAIKKNILAQFKKHTNQIIKKEAKIMVNLANIAKEQLIALGILRKNIQVSPECTYCLLNKYFSYRRNANKNLETMIAYLMLKKN